MPFSVCLPSRRWRSFDGLRSCRSSKYRSEPTKRPPLRSLEMRRTRSSAGRYSHWSVLPSALSMLSRPVPAMSSGLRKRIRLAVSPCRFVEPVGDEFADARRAAFLGQHHAAERDEVASVGAVVDLLRQIGGFVGVCGRCAPAAASAAERRIRRGSEKGQDMGYPGACVDGTTVFQPRTLPQKRAGAVPPACTVFSAEAI